MRKFLPPGGPYQIADPKHGEFTAEDSELLQRIGDGIDVRDAQTRGRIPSPVSRAYMFFVNLFLRSLGEDGEVDQEEQGLRVSSGRENLQRKARHTFRGILATFALRDVLRLDMDFRSVQISADAGPVNEVLIPALQSTPGGERRWNPVQFYTIRTNGSEEVLAGQSPLTGVFPSATQPEDLRSLYWYDPEGASGSGRWYDPTGETLDQEGQFLLSEATRQKVSGLLKAWLDRVLTDTSMDALQRDTIGMEARDAQLVIQELEEWRSELGNVPVPEGADVVSDPLAQGPGADEPAFLSLAVQSTPEHIWSDLPLHEGRLIVTHERLRDGTTRIYGRQFGKSEFDNRIEDLPRTGNNLGKALGLGEEAIPMPFLFIDRMFTPYLTLLTVDGFSREWGGLTVQNDQQTEYYLVPLAPKILEVMDRKDLIDSLSARLDSNGRNYIVQLQFGDTEITKLYSTTGEGSYQLDPDIGRGEFDLRLFPNFDLEAVGHLLSDDDQHADERYYARLRLSPHWDFDKAEPFAVDDSRRGESRNVRRNVQSELFHLGDESEPQGEACSPGKAAFYAIPEKPDGFFVPQRGFCLLDLEDPRPSEISPAEWTVGIDFGTSNTCVAYQEAEDQEPDILQLPILTTTLLERPNYNAKFEHVFEGASAALDFFYKFGRGEEEMMSQLYFPTQVLTQQRNIASDDNFELKNGLIYFDNISLNDPTLLSLIKGYPKAQEDVPQRFSVKQDIKWEKTDWLRVFMHHLRKQVLLTAASRNAKVEEVHFSYPKSFGLNQRKRFETDLGKVWGDNGDLAPQLTSESEAARDYVVQGRNQHVIFDIGGGTTEIIAFDNQRPVFQTSFKLAAGQINDYVVSAPTFREKFVEAIKRTAKQEVLEGQIIDSLLEKFTIDPQTPRDRDTVLQLWLGLLQQITDADRSNSGALLAQILNYLRTEAERGGAVQGFFLSNALLLGGLSYYSGQLLGEASEGGFEERRTFNLSRVPITMTGNGSRLYNMLTIEEEPFSDIMGNLFRRGLRDDVSDGGFVQFEGLFSYQGEIAPKVTVALGLLRDSGQEELEDVPVANIVGEEGYPYDTSEGVTQFDSSLVSFYQAVADRDISFEPPREVPKNLGRFLTGLGEELPYGRHGQFEVIPDCRDGWTEDLKTDLYRRAVPLIKDRGYENADLAEGIEKEPEDKRPALEPLFVAQVVGLVEAIREQYAE
jgi:hypothetical protein